MSTIEQIVQRARAKGCSDIHLVSGMAPVMRRDGEIFEWSEAFEKAEYTDLILGMMDEGQKVSFAEGNDVDFAYSDQMGMRYRVNVYRRGGKAGAAIRLLNDTIPTVEELGLPEVFRHFSMLPRGLVLITGPTGSGKSTTLASMIDHANTYRKGHILTVEDPVEYVFENKASIVSQREAGKDVKDFQTALRSALREDPDIILVGEMRDFETISAAITAAETGHLVLSTLHTTGAAKSIDRIIDVFPAHQQSQIRAQLATVLRGVVTQQLVPKNGGGRTVAIEVLACNDAIANMIREGKTFQIDSAIHMGSKEGMVLMDKSLADLVKQGIVSKESAMEKCVSAGDLRRFLGEIG